MKFKLLGLALMLGAVFCAPAQAQTVPGTAKISWVLPTTGCTVGVTPCDNVPMTGRSALTAIKVYVSTSPIPDNSAMDPTLTLGPTLTTTTHSLNVANGSTLYVRSKLCNKSGVGDTESCSGFTNQASKLVQVPTVPNVPSSVTIELTIGQ